MRGQEPSFGAFGQPAKVQEAGSGEAGATSPMLAHWSAKVVGVICYEARGTR